MPYSLKIQKLLITRDEQNSPNDRINTLKQAIKLADTHNDIDWGFELRLELIREEKDTARCIESFPAFAWILDAFDTHPDTFDEEEFLWEYKWMLGSSRRNSDISMEQIEGISEDFKTRLLRNGFSLRPYYTAKSHLAFSMGKLDQAQEFIELRDKEVIDNMSNCRACEMDDNVELYLRRGEFDKAFAIGNELLNKKVTCAHMPFSTYCSSTYFLAKAGQLDLAATYFDKAVEDLNKMDSDSSQLTEIGDLIYYLTLVDKEKAWAFFEKHADWNIDSEGYIDLTFSIRVLPLLKSSGERTMQVNSQLPWFRNDGVYVIKDLYQHFYAKAEVLAKQFDTRNGTHYLTALLNEAVK